MSSSSDFLLCTCKKLYQERISRHFPIFSLLPQRLTRGDKLSKRVLNKLICLDYAILGGGELIRVNPVMTSCV